MQTDKAVIGPEQYDAVLFDMDGVVTQTATVHFAAWKHVFDQVLKQKEGDNFKPFTQEDYLDYVDGKPREEGIESFLQARKIDLPKGDLENNTDKPGLDTVSAVGQLKDNEFLNIVHTKGVEPYQSTVNLIHAIKAAGISVGLVTASQNGLEILRVSKLITLFDAIVTGIDTRAMHLHGKPKPDTFLECARRLDVLPSRAVVFEDAEAGVAAGHNGKFGLVIGVARQNNKESLIKHGANCAVTDLAEVLVKDAHGADLLSNGGNVGPASTQTNWVLTYDKFVPEQEMQRESLCALGNGKFCTRGAWSFAKAGAVHYPGTYIAGGYDSIVVDTEGRSFEREELVNMPNWLALDFKIDGDDWFDLKDVEILSFAQQLNLRHGVLYRAVTVKDKQGRETEITQRSFVHMRFSHIAGVELSITALNWAGTCTIRSAIDGTVVNNGDGGGSSFAGTKHLVALESSAEKETIFLKTRTSQTELVVAQAAHTVFLLDQMVVDPARTNQIESEYVAQTVAVALKVGQNLTAQKTVSLFTSRDRGTYEPGLTARTAVLDVPDFSMLVNIQFGAWRSLWRQFDLFIETDDKDDKLFPSLLIHLNSFHTIQTASPHTVDLDTGIPPRGWTGEGYQGHVFWDDLFVFPYINLRLPNISAALLSYRYRRIGEARKIALTHGARGACFPWESASDGRERTPDYSWMTAANKWIEDFTSLEMHVNGAIAYNVWQYFQVTSDFRFMYSYGSEILLEIARFWATFAKYNESRQRYEIHGVIGPDEFHKRYPGATEAGINNNAYTNVLAVWTLCRALEFLDIMPGDLRSHICERLHITEDEIKLWHDVSRKMYVPISDQGIISEFEGFENLEEFPGFVDNKLDNDAVARALIENDGVLNQYKICKQADVLMLMYIFTPAELKELFDRLGYKFDYATMAANADYYIPRTANESTLSRVAHAWVLSRLDRLRATHLLPDAGEQCKSMAKCSEEIFFEALGSDYYDVASRGTARTGIHMGAMAGTVDIVQRCYTGIVMRDDVLWFDPALPEPLSHLVFNMRYRNHSLAIDITATKLTVATRSFSDQSIAIGYRGQSFALKSGESKEIELLTSRTL